MNNLLALEQHGFVSKKSCTTNLLETLDLLTSILAQGLFADVIYLDFSKAFDTVPHKRLIKKLEAYGIVNKTLNWIKAFLINREQRVTLGDSISEWSKVSSGVPQGSVLGPLLFVIYINDLPKELFSKSKLYADDCKLIGDSSNSTNLSLLQSDLDRVQLWCEEWGMNLNGNKCKVIHFGRNNPNMEYVIKNKNDFHNLQESNYEKDLGVYITKSLS